MLLVSVSPYMGDGIPRTSGGMDCEECEATGAQPTEVTFVNETNSTLSLCENCLTKFESAVLVEEAKTTEVA